MGAYLSILQSLDCLNHTRPSFGSRTLPRVTLRQGLATARIAAGSAATACSIYIYIYIYIYREREREILILVHPGWNSGDSPCERLWYRCLWTKQSFCMSLGHATRQQKLQSSPRWCAFIADSHTSLLIRSKDLFTDTGSLLKVPWGYCRMPSDSMCGTRQI